MGKDKIKVIELFAGVGGFRLGLEKAGLYEIIWSNQWEPSTKKQHASLVYEARFGQAHHSNEDISSVPTKEIPDHQLLVGGFPCQDYSVATTLVNSKGLIGKKGVLWWTIHRILSEKKKKPDYLFLENVDRLLTSPATQRGRDFAVMLSSLNALGYAVEWRVINAADYGMPQRRRRVFFLGYKKGTVPYKKIKADRDSWIMQNGTIAKAFPINPSNVVQEFSIDSDLVQVTEQFNKGQKHSPFLNTGLMINGQVYCKKTNANYKGEKTVLGSIIEEGEVSKEFYIPKKDMKKWTYLKGAKKEVRKTKAGYEYKYSEGRMIFPDAKDNSSRTIITGEGGPSPSRFKHVVETPEGLRRLTPRELERLNMFPDDHTKLNGISDTKRAFFMGNALVVGVVTRIASSLAEQIKG